MGFYEWMIEKYIRKDTARGDLARDMEHSGDFPKTDSKELVYDYLLNKNACDECIQVFKRCWRDYEREYR